MSRRASVVARLVCLVVAALLLVAGAAAMGWHWNIGGVRYGVITYPDTTTWPDAEWWPWALGAAAGVAFLGTVALCALVLVRPRVGTWTLAGSGPDGALTADVFAVASAAAQAFELLDDVLRASYRVRNRDGVCVVELTLLCTGDVDLDRLDRAARADAAVLAEALGGALAQRIYVQVERSH